MSIKYLGEQFDIHCGGADHIPVHHTNEVAQSEAATGKHPWVRYWLHNEFMVFNKEKMSKSSGELLTIGSVRERGIDPLAFRMFCFTAHYRSPLTFSWGSLEASASSLRNMRTMVSGETDGEGEDAAAVERALEGFWAAAGDDFNMPKAVAALWEVVRDGACGAGLKRAAVREADAVLGLDLLKTADEKVPEYTIHIGESTVHVSGHVDAGRAEQVAKRVVERAAARRRKDFAEADRLRDELSAEGVVVKDMPDGATRCEIE